jgi:hypothetical protein
MLVGLFQRNDTLTLFCAFSSQDYTPPQDQTTYYFLYTALSGIFILEMTFIVIFFGISLKIVYTYMKDKGYSFSWPMMLCHLVFCAINYLATVMMMVNGNKIIRDLLFAGNNPESIFTDLYLTTISFALI